MKAWLLLIPLISVLSGWIISRIIITLLFHPVKPRTIAGFRLQGLLPAKQALLSIKLEELIREHLVSSGELQQMVLSPATFQKILPKIESHIDHFLKVTLKEKMPMVGALVGERTTSQMKTIFMDELEALFPVVIKDYSAELLSDPEVPRRIARKLGDVPAHDLETGFRRLFAGEFRRMQWIGVSAGLIVGVIQLLTSLIFYS